MRGSSFAIRWRLRIYLSVPRVELKPLYDGVSGTEGQVFGVDSGKVR